MVSQVIHCQISGSPNKRMTGVELCRVMAEADLTPNALALRLGGCWPRTTVYRMVKREFIDLHPVEMEELLTALGATTL
ncbi:hypothetical protein LCGC14_1822270 [marine sediment metagenome]|uniref:HTH cro/C1-type domain-containing protein n=1 Tax=marine sediment metagenome TaxID=412755 RepID=A0A0F9JI27_9ZZZZ